MLAPLALHTIQCEQLLISWSHFYFLWIATAWHYLTSPQKHIWCKVRSSNLLWAHSYFASGRIMEVCE